MKKAFATSKKQATAYQQGYKDCCKDANDISKVTRFEVIDHTKPVEDGGGRRLVERGVSVSLSLQDDGRTLKVFIDKKEE